ncbi:hypothetical protein Pd630_LPD10080 (plasmid) [Rhodococcus opacus PD630]|nr:hypothetical protein Pd630_LPD10080 [Rhodococcus opacus PD630]
MTDASGAPQVKPGLHRQMPVALSSGGDDVSVLVGESR